MVFSATAIKQSFLKINKPKSYSIWQGTILRVRVISDLAVKMQTDPLPAPTTMANSHRFDDVAHINICLGIGNHHYTVCINSLLSLSPACPCTIFYIDSSKPCGKCMFWHGVNEVDKADKEVPLTAL